MFNRKYIFGIYLISIIILLNSCQVEQFDEKTPYATLVKKYRNYYEALKTSDRLHDLGLKSYIIKQNNPSEGLWYNVILGKQKILEQMMEDKMIYEDDFGLQNLSIVNFNKVRSETLPIHTNLPKSHKLKLNRPFLKQKLSETLKLIPHKETYSIQHFKLLNSNDSINVLKFSSVKKMNYDLPRGMTLRGIMKNADIITETLYKDEILGSDLLLHVVKLKENINFNNQSIVDYYTNAILDTREYKYEEAIPISVDVGIQLNGNVISLTPKENKIVHYIVLTDPQNKFLIFLQSIQNKLPQMKSFFNSFNKNYGVSTYNAFFNSFYLLPTNDKKDKLLTYQLEKNATRKGYSNNIYTGHYLSKHTFFNENSENWELKIIHTTEHINKTILLDKELRRKRKIYVDSFNMYNSSAYITFTGKRTQSSIPDNKPADNILFSFYSGIGEVSTKNKSKIAFSQLAKRANNFQLNTKENSEDEEDYINDFFKQKK